MLSFIAMLRRSVMLLRFLSICCALCTLTGCLSHVQYNGYPSTNIKRWDNVKEGASKTEIINVLGYPVLEEDNNWIYPSCMLQKVAASIFREYSCDVLKVAFDADDNVETVVRLHTPTRSLHKVLKSKTSITGIHDGIWRKVERVFGAAS